MKSLHNGYPARGEQQPAQNKGIRLEVYMEKKSLAHRIAFYGVLSALMFVFLLTETYAFSFLFGQFTPAILTLPLAVGISLFGDKKTMFVGGTIFGACSFVLSFIIGFVVFMNPLVSILPRVFIGVVAYFVYLFVSWLTKNAKSKFLREILPLSLAGAFGILTNTVLTLTMMWVFNSAELAAVISTIMSVNFVAEVIGGMVLVPIYVGVLKRIDYKL